MAAVATTPLGQTAEIVSPPPQVSAETWNAMAAREREYQRSPERFLPTPIQSSRKYVFRTERGTVRGLKHYLPTMPRQDADPDDKKAKILQRAFTRARRFDPPGFAALIERVRDEIGNELNFRPIMTRTECIYETDSDDVAEYIRILMKQQLGEFQHVYEQMPRSRVVVGSGDLAKAFPNTVQGLLEAQKYMTKHDITSMNIVKDED